MKLRIFKDSESLSNAAANLFIETAAQAIDARGRFMVALSGGGSPTGLYRLLAGETFRDKVDWEKAFIFWGDERCVPPDEESSNYHQAFEILLRHVPIPDKNVLRIQGELTPHEASEEYAQTLKEFADPNLEWPRLDLALLGMGADGHTASLFPGSDIEVNSPTLAVTAHYQSRPANRVTLTPVVLNSARKAVFLVTGKDKAETLSRVLSNVSMPEQYPAQHIQPTDGELIWLVDEAAALYISPKWVE